MICAEATEAADRAIAGSDAVTAQKRILKCIAAPENVYRS
ncbi:hypothetical protein C725_0403 [Pacificimonas flava]|uniref:Uncharacterized protein n=1 Tax=Pacificimonas flava TaxID=1234595 RepID=M2U907_9SPHN|nr:hypothetical protein C725_0403 [Pacificimonas flava]